MLPHFWPFEKLPQKSKQQWLDGDTESGGGQIASQSLVLLAGTVATNLHTVSDCVDEVNGAPPVPMVGAVPCPGLDV